MVTFSCFTSGFFLCAAALFTTLKKDPAPLTAGLYMACLFLLYKMFHHFPALKKKRHSIYLILSISIILQVLFGTLAGMPDRLAPLSGIKAMGESYNNSHNGIPVFYFKMFLLNVAMLLPLYTIIKKEKIPVQRLLFLSANPALLFALSFFSLDQTLTCFIFFLHIALLNDDRPLAGFSMAGMAVSLTPWLAATLPFSIDRRNCKKAPVMLLPLSLFILWKGVNGFSGECLPLSSTGLSLENGTQMVLFFILAALYGMIWLTVHNPVRSLFILTGFLALSNPMAATLPLLMMLPFAALFLSPPWLFLWAALFIPVGPMAAPPSGTACIFLTYVVFFSFFLKHTGRTGSAPAFPYNRVSTLSVIIPALNEEHNIRYCLKSLWGQQAVSEIIIADGGSSDRTGPIAETFGARVLHCRKGRGSQIADAMKKTSGDVLLILHADCRLAKDGAAKILNRLNRDRSLAGGAFLMGFFPTDLKKRVIAALNNLRAATTGISFGDQGQFVRKEALASCDGFPDQMLMEDVELSLRLKNRGRLTLIPGGVTVSGRRWDTRGFSSNFTTVIRLFTTYLVQRRLGFIKEGAETYYHTYYKREK